MLLSPMNICVFAHQYPSCGKPRRNGGNISVKFVIKDDEKWERGSAVEAETDGPVDFTIKSEHSTPPPAPDLTDMAAFLASAAAAVRTAHQVRSGNKKKLIKLLRRNFFPLRQMSDDW